MTIELQIRSSALGTTTASAVQTQLRATCFPSVGAVQIDHADVAATPVEVFAANGTVQLRVLVDIFAVQRAKLLASPNATSAGTLADRRKFV
jgi:hypothetical protein